MNETIAELRTLDLFAGLDDDALHALVRCTRRERYARGRSILQQEPERDGVAIVVRGAARVYRTAAEGQDLTLDTLGAGGIFGLVFLAPEARSRSGLEATADDTVIYWFAPQHFGPIVVAHPELAMMCLMDAERRITALCDRVEDLALHNVPTRLAHELARLAWPGRIREGWCGRPMSSWGRASERTSAR